MPDWFYRTLSRPVLFRLPAQSSRALALGFMGGLAGLPFGVGARVIDFLGHMQPDARLAKSLGGTTLSSPVGLGPRLDPAGRALRAWARFGFGFVEVGPISPDGLESDVRMERRVDEQALWMADPGEGVGLRALHTRLQELRRARSNVPVLVRLGVRKSLPPAEAASFLSPMLEALRGDTGFFTLELPAALRHWSAADWSVFWRAVGTTIEPSRVLLVLPTDSEVETGTAVSALVDAGGGGVLVDASLATGGGRVFGMPAKSGALLLVRRLRETAGAALPIIASGGIHQPADAREYLDAGATFIQIDTGLIYSGPGLCKRINEALIWQELRGASAAALFPVLRPAECSWFWTALLGVAMLIGSALALVIASSRVVLPYDEAFCGWTRPQMQQFNPRLLSFLSHDRVTLAGTMVSIGLLYLTLSWKGVRHGLHWARAAVLTSAGAGFFSFFLFLGFGYFDPFHGFVTAILFQLFAMGVHAKESPCVEMDPPDWTETRAWRLGQWGQLLLVLHSVGLLGAGMVIAGVGVGDVFVAEDLAYLQASLDGLRSANSRLIPLVAHDRATLGGMLLAVGLVYLLASLWGLRRGAAWVWQAFLWSGLAAYAAAIGVHYAVGYVDVRHLLPAFTGLGLLLCGLGFSRSWCYVREGSSN